MAEDLSQTIQDGIAQTLTDLLGIDTKFQETTKVDRRDIRSIELLEVNAEFEFDKLPTLFKFFIPASSASIIFNTMMGSSDFEIDNTLDDDTIDAMGEFVSNVSGSLVTAFNAKEIAELGNSKFHIQHKETLDGDSIEDIDNMYRFVIDLDEQPIIVFIGFDKSFLPFIEEIIKSEPTPHPEEKEPKEEEEQEEEQDEILSNSEEAIQNTPSKETQDDEETKIDNKASNEEEEEQEDLDTQKKSKKLKIIIIAVSALLTLVLITFLIFLIMSPKEEEMPKVETTMAEKKGEMPKTEPITTTSTKTLKKVDFKIKDIDVPRINARLATLTKYEILTPEELALQKQEEALMLQQIQKEEELMEFAKQNKEEPVEITPEPKKEEPEVVKETPQEQMVQQQETPNKSEVPMVQKEEPTTPSAMEKEQPITEQKEQLATEVATQTQPKQETPDKTLLFILSNDIKYTLFRSLVQKTSSKSARISMCNDPNGRTTIFIGPFENEEILAQMDQLIEDSNQNILTEQSKLTQEQFNQRCNF